ncbi:MAG: hypothetical protein GX567_07715 [Clostridia bacterium]|nr:hypothetical protein [Clostridia bacterium]
MIELPESITIVKQLNEMIKDKMISEILINHSPHRFAFCSGSQEEYAQMLEGKRITGCVSRAGIIEIQAEDAKLTLNDGAYPRYFEEEKRHPKSISFCLLLTTIHV